MSSNLRDHGLPEMEPTRDLKIINERLHSLRNDREKPCHLLGPGVRSLNRLEQLPEMFHVVWHGFLFDPSPEGPHVYHDNSWKAKQVALKREALLELWLSADGKHIMTERCDDRKEAWLAEYKWTGAILGLNGIPIPKSAQHQLDLRDGSADAQLMLGGSTPNVKQLLKARAKITQLCESKAQNRVIRDLLGISQTYTEEQMKWPFVLMKIVFIPDLKDPITKALVTAQALGMSAAVFGSGGAAGAELMRQLLGPRTEDTPDRERVFRQVSDGGGQHQIESGAAQVDEDLPFDVEPQPPAKAVQLNTMADFEVLESTSDLQSGTASAALIMALEDLKSRNPNNKKISITKPVNEWKPAARRMFVERMLKKD